MPRLLMLEDDFSYVLKKALIGNGMSPAELASISGVAESEVLAFSRGRFSKVAAERIAPFLGLNPVAFGGHATYEPEVAIPRCVHRIDLPFGSERVNAWLVLDDEECILFDAGYESDSLVDAVLKIAGRMPDRVFVTHEHRDHIAALPRLIANGVPVYSADIKDTNAIAAGEGIVCGKIKVTACDLSGHARPALGFHIDGLDDRLFVVGDAIFAGSIGGCSSPEIYQMALRSIHSAIDHLTDETILLPGHGPATSLGSERRMNPFL